MDPRERFDPNEATADETAPDPLTSTEDVRTAGTTQFVPGADAAAIGPAAEAGPTGAGGGGGGGEGASNGFADGTPATGSERSSTGGSERGSTGDGGGSSIPGD